MTRRATPAPRSRALEAGHTRSAGDAGSADAVSICDDSTPNMPGSRTKAIVVTVLVTVWELSPKLAIALAHAVAWVWPGWWRA